MFGSRRLTAVGVVAALALVGTGSAIAAPPQRIYEDLADNGKLDGVYSRADLDRALNPRQVLHMDDQQPASRQRSLERRLPEDPVVAPTVREKKSSSRVPFSGLDVALLVAGGGPLLLIGAAFRRRLAPAPSEARAST